MQKVSAFERFISFNYFFQVILTVLMIPLAVLTVPLVVGSSLKPLMCYVGYLLYAFFVSLGCYKILMTNINDVLKACVLSLSQVLLVFPLFFTINLTIFHLLAGASMAVADHGGTMNVSEFFHQLFSSSIISGIRWTIGSLIFFIPWSMIYIYVSQKNHPGLMSNR